ncbi:type IV pilin protein [Undibacterium sp. Ren11W]|uniref:type IV pilin protein n=1 Tax=Undibacterium sp. Ren11W TaxID=3413045 RepID=UPI003BEF9669
MQTMKQSKRNGFTLIEVMITVVIVGVLASIALPNYTAYVKRAKRADAMAVLLKNANWMQQQFTIDNKFPASATVLPFAQSPEAGTARYNISIVVPATANTSQYTLQAVPVAADECATFTLDHTGLRGQSGTASKSATACWAGQ